MIMNKQNSLIKDENGDNLVNIAQKKAIKYGASAVLGVGIAKFISISSASVDKFFFYTIGNFLSSSKYSLMFIPIPNWFLVLCVIGYGVIAVVTAQKYARELKK